jgi:hypothetical protein
VLYETIAAAAARADPAVEPVLRALAAAASSPAVNGEEAVNEADGAEKPEWASHPLILHPYGGRLLKRVLQGVPAFAPLLLETLSGSLQNWATQGGGWSVLALLESPHTGKAVRAELSGEAGAAIAASEAPGCRSLAAALGAAAPPKVTAVPPKKGTVTAVTPKKSTVTAVATKNGTVSAGIQKSSAKESHKKGPAMAAKNSAAGGKSAAPGSAGAKLTGGKAGKKRVAA